MTAKLFYQVFIISLYFGLSSLHAGAQTTTIVDSTRDDSVTVIAGEQYRRSGLHNKLWGTYYRKEWSTPIRVPRLRLDTVLGGLTPTEKAGGKQTRHLRLKAANGRQYSIRSVDKRYGKSLPEDLQGTFVADIVDDQMSSAYPYGGIVVKKLAAAAGIFTTNPVLYFVGDDKQLDSFRNEFANQLYTLEDRPGSDNAKYYGAIDVIDTDELVEILKKNRDAMVDQAAFVKARLFDLLIGDWDRHKDQWEWAKMEENGKIVYRPLPKDRDQALSSYEGLIVNMVTKSQIPWMQKFDETIKDVPGMTFFYRPVDMPMTNQQPYDVWIQKANELKQQVTDAVIEDAVKQLPAEIYQLSGQDLIQKLKGRRDRLTTFAHSFYRMLASEVDILATENNDLIEVTHVDDKVRLNIYSSGNNVAQEPYYSRTFIPSETKEIRIYGISGNDRYTVTGENTSGTKLRFIGGDGKDVYETATSSKKLYIYDNSDNTFNSGAARLRISEDSAVHKYDDKRIPKRDDFGIGPRLGYTNEDRIYIGLGLRLTDFAFRKAPYGSRNDLSVKYSITQKAFSYSYTGMFIEILGKWSLGLLAEYDEVRDQDFLGLGNNTVITNDERRFYRYRNKEANAAVGLIRKIRDHTFTVSGIYQMVQLLPDDNKFIVAHFDPAVSKVYTAKHFAGGRLEYDITRVNDRFVPNKGFRFNTSAEYAFNLKEDKDITRGTVLLGAIFPLGPFTFASKVGTSHVSGEPEFYQLNNLGGGNNLRGFSRFRFYGNTALYNQNELQWNFNVKTYLYSGKIGLVALFDNGRVWIPGEKSDKWHAAVGGGITLVPFNKLSVTAAYAVSKEDGRLSLRIGHFLRR